MIRNKGIEANLTWSTTAVNTVLRKTTSKEKVPSNGFTVLWSTLFGLTPQQSGGVTQLLCTLIYFSNQT